MENKNEILIHIPIDLKLRREHKEKETFRVALGEWQGFSPQTPCDPMLSSPFSTNQVQPCLVYDTRQDWECSE